MGAIARSVEFLGRHGTLVMVASIILGLFVTQLAALLRPFLAASVVALLAVTIMRVEAASLRALAARPVPALGAVFWILIATPLLLGAGLYATGFAASYPVLTLSLVLLATAPPIASSPAVSLLIGLNHTLSLVVLLAAAALIPLTTPLMADLLLDQPLPLDSDVLMVRLIVLIGSAGLLGLAGRWMFGMARIRARDELLDGLSVIALIVFAISIMDGILARIVADFAHVLRFAALAFAVNLALLAATTLLFRRAGRRDAATIGFSAGNRNMALVISALGTTVPDDTWLFFVLVQFPIYMLPAALKPLYRRWLRAE